MRKKRLTVSIVLPNWNGAQLLVKNLPKVIAAAPGAEIIVVDDCSTDNSVEVLRSKFPSVQTIVKEQNSGFARSVNMGVERAHGDVVVLLNTDVVPEQGFLTPLLSHFSDPMVFAVGCLEKNPEGEKVVLRGRSIAHWQKGFYIHDRGEVDKSDTAWVSGGSGAFRRSLWNKIGGLDTIYNPFYWEDIDISYRAKKAGYKIVFEAKSAVWHYHQQGAIKTQFQKERVQRIVFRNQFIFIWKNLSDGAIWMDHLIWTPVRLVQELLKGHTAMAYGFFLALGKLPTLLKHRYIQRSLWGVGDSTIM